MNYRHAFHAGNFADVHKHAVLARLLTRLRDKPTAFRVIDSHAGAGRYHLHGPEAARAGEWRDGVGRVFSASFAAPVAALLEPYREAVAAQNREGELRFYPGSPLVALSLLRAQDRLIACETEPAAAASLARLLHGDRRAKALALDGWMAVNANVPPKERRGLVLIDPPYEDAADFEKLGGVLAAAYRKWPGGIYMLWYPIKERGAPDALARRLRRLAVPKILRSEVALGPPRADAGLIGSGLVIVNPPHKLEDELGILLPALARLLSPVATQRLDWLAGEGPSRRGSMKTS